MLKYLIIVIAFISCESAHDGKRSISENRVESMSLDDFLNQTKDGDIVLKMGYGSISKMIATQLNEEIQLSHCGIIYKKNDTAFVIHSVSGELVNTDGVQSIGFEKFHSDVRPKSLIILRHKDSNSRYIISEKAKEILDSKIPFDHDFDLSNSDKLYCSEFVEDVLKETFGKSYFQTKNINGTDIYTFNSIINSSDIEVVNR